MRLTLQLVVSVLIFDAVNARFDSTSAGSNSNHRVESRGHPARIQGGRRPRSLKKGAVDDDGGDYYYGSERHNKHGGKGKGKEKDVTVPSIAPISMLPIAHAPIMADENNPNNPPSLSPQYQMDDDEEILIMPPKKIPPDKNKKGMDMMNSKKLSPPKGGKGKGKGKGKGGVADDDAVIYNDDYYNGGGNMGPCAIHTAIQISTAVPEIITRNPISCCYSTNTEVVAVYITHALPSKYTTSGFEPFWDQIYSEIERTSRAQHVCFVMTGLNGIPTTNEDDRRSIEQILFDTIGYTSELPNVAAIMTTDPTTENTNLMDEVRRIYNNPRLPSIGVFNAGYNNIIIESIVQNEGRLPYIGYLDDVEYGRQAGRVTLDLLNGTAAIPPVPLCFNARIGVIDALGDRCAAYYNELSSTEVVAVPDEIGVPCRPNSTMMDLTTLLSDTTRGSINAVWAPLECCLSVTNAVEALLQQSSSSRRIIVGCQDDDPTNGRINFYTAQPIALQGYMTASWANFPVLQQQSAPNVNDPKEPQYFPALQSLVHTAIYNTVVSLP